MRTALKRAGWVTMMAAGWAWAAVLPASAAPLPPVVSPGKGQTAAPFPSPPAAPARTPQSARLLEMYIEMAWLADPLTFPFPLAARVVGNSVEVGGLVPDDTVRERALLIARRESGLSPVDKTVRRSLATPPPTPSYDGNLCRAAIESLTKAFGADGDNLQIAADSNGQIIVSGMVASHAEKLRVSRRLSQLTDCTSVVNWLEVRSETRHGKAMTRLSADGDDWIAEEELLALPKRLPPLAAAPAPAPRPLTRPVTAPLTEAKLPPPSAAPMKPAPAPATAQATLPRPFPTTGHEKELPSSQPGQLKQTSTGPLTLTATLSVPRAVEAVQPLPSAPLPTLTEQRLSPLPSAPLPTLTKQQPMPGAFHPRTETIVRPNTLAPTLADSQPSPSCPAACSTLDSQPKALAPTAHRLSPGLQPCSGTACPTPTPGVDDHRPSMTSTSAPAMTPARPVSAGPAAVAVTNPVRNASSYGATAMSSVSMRPTSAPITQRPIPTSPYGGSVGTMARVSMPAPSQAGASPYGVIPDARQVAAAPANRPLPPPATSPYGGSGSSVAMTSRSPALARSHSGMTSPYGGMPIVMANPPTANHVVKTPAAKQPATMPLIHTAEPPLVAPRPPVQAATTLVVPTAAQVATPPPPVAPSWPQNVEQRIRTLGQGELVDVQVSPEGKSELRIRLHVHSTEGGTRLAQQILQLPELGPYRVSLEVKVAH